MNPQPPLPYGDPQAPYPPPAPRKATPVWVWILAAVAVLAVLAGVAVVATGLFIYKTAKDASDRPTAALAKMAELANPDIEVVHVDEAAGKVTIREKDTGKTFTVTVDQIKSGRLEISSDEGKVEFGGDSQTPEWVPLYPGAERTTVMNSRTVEADAGTVSLLAKEDYPKVRAWYDEQLAAGGFTVNSTATGEAGDAQGAVVTASRNDERQSINIIFNKEGDSTRATVSFQGKK